MVTLPPIQLATLGWEDSLILMVLALVVFGPRRLPLIGRQIGKLMYEFRKASNDFKFQMEEELRASEEADRRKKEEAERQRVAALAAQTQASVSAPAQTVESMADVGAIETHVPPGYPEPYPPESTSGNAESAAAGPVIQPPSTGEQVAAGLPEERPDYYFQPSEAAPASEVNPDADVTANAEEFTASVEAQPPVPEAPPQEGMPPAPPGAAAKETVSQHG